MNRSRVRQAAIAATLLSVGLLPPAYAQQSPPSDLVRLAMETVFHPGRMPEARSMGIYQFTSFADHLQDAGPKMQVCFVVDATDSMKLAMPQVKESIGRFTSDMALYSQSVEFALVAYYGVGRDGETVQIPLRSFASAEAFIQTVQQVQLGTGAPYFPEPIDQAIHRALTKVNWDAEDDTTKVLMVFADAPPYDSDFVEDQYGVRRWYQNEFLVSNASDRGIRINCVLCPSSEETAFRQSVDKTRAFMNEITTKTGGMLLDLDDPGVGDRIQQVSIIKPRVQYTPFPSIHQDEIDKLREAAPKPARKTTRVAVLPHASITRELSFDADKRSVQYAAMFGRALDDIEGVEVVSLHVVNRAFDDRRDLVVPGNPTQVLASLANVLQVEHVVYGRMVTSSTAEMQARSEVFHRQNGETSQCEVALKDEAAPFRLVSNSRREQENDTLFGLLRQGAARPPRTFASNPKAQPLIREAYDRLTRSAVADNNDAGVLLDACEKALLKAIGLEQDNPFPYILLASCLRNRAMLLERKGDRDRAKQLLKRFPIVLRTAHTNRSRRQLDDDAKKELEADYLLFAAENSVQNHRQALELYENLTANAKRSDILLRAHWMLIGLYLGDWGFRGLDEPNPAEARKHALQILAHWKDSPLAHEIKRNVLWDDESGRSRLVHFPKAHEHLVALMN